MTPEQQTPASVVGLTDAQIVQSFRDHYGFALNGPWPGVQTPHYALAGLFKMAGDAVERLSAEREGLRKALKRARRYVADLPIVGDAILAIIAKGEGR